MAEGDKDVERPSERLAALERKMQGFEGDLGAIKTSITGFGAKFDQFIAAADKREKDQVATALTKRRATIADTYEVDAKTLDVFTTDEQLTAHEVLLKAATQRGTALPGAKSGGQKKVKEFNSWGAHEKWKATASRGAQLQALMTDPPGDADTEEVA